MVLWEQAAERARLSSIWPSYAAWTGAALGVVPALGLSSSYPVQGQWNLAVPELADSPYEWSFPLHRIQRH